MMERVAVQGLAMPTTQQRIKQITRRSWLSFVLALLQLGAAISVLCVTRYYLETIYVATTGPAGGVWAYACFASTDFSSWSCQYAYALGAISLIFSMGVFITQCVAFDDGLGREPFIFQTVLDAVGFVWWLAGAIVFSVEINRFNQVNVSQPRQPARNGLLALCWISAGLFLMMFVVNLTISSKIKKVERGHDIKPMQQVAEPAHTAVPV